MASVFVLLEAFNRKEAAALGFFPCATAPCFWKTDGECCFVVRKTLYLNGAAHSNDQFLGYGKAKAVSGSCSGRIALI